MDEKKIDAYQVTDSDTGELLEWYGKYLWRGEWHETDEDRYSREEAEADARAILASLEAKFGKE